MNVSLSKRKNDRKLVNRISNAIKEGNISHAYIFEGDSCAGKEEFALDFLKAICCEQMIGEGCDECASCRKIEHGNCEDLYIVRAEGTTVKSVKDDAISSLRDNLVKKPLGRRNMAIICDADTMTVRAQNRFLKTLEEPSSYGTVIVLLSENRENLLDTIRSRCICYRINGEDDRSCINFHGADELIDAIIEEDKFFEIKKLLTKNVRSREDAFRILDGMERVYRNMLIGKDDRGRLFKTAETASAIMMIEQARRDLIANVNYMYALKNLVLKIGG